MERRLTTILAADVVGYTRLMGADETGTLEALKAHRRELIDPTIAAHGGRLVKLMGDGALVEFPSTVDAVACAAALQLGIAARNEAVPDTKQIAFRIGINLGDVILEGDDLYGDGVNLAARLEGLAEPGGIYISGKVHEEVKNRLELGFQDLGLRQLKNVAEPVRVFRVVAAGVPALAEEQLALPGKPSIAVLPFDNMSGDPEQEYFSDGVTEDIITELSRFRSIFVIARNSSFAYKGAAKDITKIGQDLGVRYVLEGSVRKSASRVRITAQLIEAASGTHLWAQRYDRVLEDVFALQDEITETIVAAIQPELEVAERDRAQRKPPESLDAWERYQRGMWHAYKMNSEDTARAETCFRDALALAPDYAPALAGLAYLNFLRVILDFNTGGALPRDEVLDQAMEQASAAVMADDQDAFSQFILGRLLALRGDFDEAIERATLAVELNPNLAMARHGLGYALSVSGRPADAQVQFAEALRLSPKDPYRWAFATMRAFALLQQKDYEGSVTWARKSIRDHGAVFWPYATGLAALGHLGRADEAQRMLADLWRIKPDFNVATIDKAIVFRHTADRDHYLEGLRQAGVPE